MKSTFKVFDPCYLRHLFQLRCGLSQLRYHKKRHNFVDTPTDTCSCLSDVEDTNHYLLFCPLYFLQRVTLLQSVNEILREKNLAIEINSELLLYGHPMLDTLDNKEVLLATLNFIKTTNRLFAQI